MKILLINLPRDGETQDHTTRDYLLTDFAAYPPLGLLAIAADVDPRHSLQVVDTVVKNWTIDDTVRYVTDYRPDLLGISAVTRRAFPMYEISRRVRAALPNTRIVVGGPHATYFPEETIRLGPIDYVVHGYGEKAFPLLVDAVENGERPEDLDKIGNLLFTSPDGQVHRTFDDPIPEVLDSLPFPKRQLISLKDYYCAMDRAPMTTAYSARGCPFHCIYCDVQQKRFHFRSAKSLVDEFGEIRDLGFKEIYLFDDTFNVNRQRVLDICNEILKRRLKVSWSARARVFPFDREMMRLLQEAGCKRLHVGVESLDPQILHYMKKKITLEQIHNFFALCREFKMDTVCYFIIGFPNETRKYRESLFDEVVKLDCTYAFVNILSPLAKTEYYHNLLADGTFKEDFWAEFVKHPRPNFAVPHPRSPEAQKELEVIADDFHRRFCLRPSFMFCEVKRSRSEERRVGKECRSRWSPYH